MGFAVFTPKWQNRAVKLEVSYAPSLRFRNARNLPSLLRKQRTPSRPLLVVGTSQRPHAAVHQRRNESIQGYLSGHRKARLLARYDLAEVRAGRRQAQRS